MKLPSSLTTDRLILRPHTEADFDSFFSLISDDQATKFIQIPEEEMTREGLKSFFEEVLTSLESSSPVFGLAILEKGTHRYIGFCGLSELPDGSGTETYFVIHPASWSNGYGTEAARKLIEYGFSVLNLPHVDTFLVEGNEASRKVAEKLGMKNLGSTQHHEYQVPVARYRIFKESYFPDLP